METRASSTLGVEPKSAVQNIAQMQTLNPPSGKLLECLAEGRAQV